MRTRVSKQSAHDLPPGGRAGMTLVEVIVSLAITILIIAGIVHGYIYCITSATKSELAQAAVARGMERLEEARSATWNTSSTLAQDQLVATNFPDQVFILDMPGTNSAGTPVTLKTTIAQISVSPPLRTIHVDCIWRFRGADWVTNSLETMRAADQ